MLYELVDHILGLTLSAQELSLMHLIMRMLVIYILALTLIRAQRQLMTIRTPFNYILNIIIGSIFANAIIGTVPYVTVTAVGFIMSLITWAISIISFHFPSIDIFIKGHPALLVKDGEIQWDTMRENLITKDELMDSLHRNTRKENLADIKCAYFENSGRITFVLKQ